VYTPNLIRRMDLTVVHLVWIQCESIRYRNMLDSNVAVQILFLDSLLLIPLFFQ
jgi:hypothetical protein